MFNNRILPWYEKENIPVVLTVLLNVLIFTIKLMNNRLDKKIAVVTGGARGIGKAITKLFIKHGAQVIVVDLLDKVYKDRNPNNNCNYLKLDVSKRSTWKKIHSYIKAKYYTIDILVNNAAISGTDMMQNPEKSL